MRLHRYLDDAGRAASGVVVLALLLAGCGAGGGGGGGEYSPDHAEGGTPAPDTQSLAYKDLTDSASTSLRLAVSGQSDADTDALNIFVVVKDQNGTSLTALNKHNFGVQLNPSTAPRVVETDDVSLTTEVVDDRLVALAIDSSGSMSAVDSSTGQTRMEAAKSAAKLYVDRMGAGELAAIVTFSSAARTVQPLTDNKALLVSAIDSLNPDGATNLGAAVSRAVEAVGARPGKRAMILLTDGDDTVDSVTGGPNAWLNNGQSTRNQGLVAAEQNDFRIYTVGLGTDLSDTGLADLQTFADLTGGTFIQAPTASALTTPFSQTIPDEIEALPPMETFVLSFPNPYTPNPGTILNVAFGVSVGYENANGLLTRYASGVIQIP